MKRNHLRGLLVDMMDVIKDTLSEDLDSSMNALNKKFPGFFHIEVEGGYDFYLNELLIAQWRN